MDFVESSDLLKQTQGRVKTLKIPFNEIPIGKSVIIPIDAIKETYLRNVVCQTNKRLAPKHFACIKHKQHGIFEVGRIADVITEVVETVILQQFDSSPQMGEQ
jgi:hypothetical protein